MGYIISIILFISGMIKCIGNDAPFAGVYLVTSAIFFAGQYIGDSIQKRKETDDGND